MMMISWHFPILLLLFHHHHTLFVFLALQPSSAFTILKPPSNDYYKHKRQGLPITSTSILFDAITNQPRRKCNGWHHGMIDIVPTIYSFHHSTCHRRMMAYRDEECSLDNNNDSEQEIYDCLLEAGYTDVTTTTTSESSASDIASATTSSSLQHVIITKVFVAELETLRHNFPSYETSYDMGSNMIKYNKRKKQLQQSSSQLSSDVKNTHIANMEYNHLVDDQEMVLVDTVRIPGMSSISRAFVRAGPRKQLHFNPQNVTAAIVTCGGLCPGLNAVIRELVHSLYYMYDIHAVYGIQGGFHGFHNNENLPPILLTNDMVENIHHDGGTILKSARGGFDNHTIIDFIKSYDIQQLYIIGGDGSHRVRMPK